MFSQTKLRYALWAHESAKPRYLRDAKTIMTTWLNDNEQSESTIARDATQLLNCITQGGDVFTRLADHLRSQSLEPRDKIWTMNALLSRYISVFAMSDAVATARYFHTEMAERSTPTQLIVLAKMAGNQLRLTKMYKKFWDAVDSMFQTCPTCKARGIYRRWRGVVISVNDRPGQGCRDVDSIVDGYYGIKASAKAYNPAIAAFALSFPKRNRYSSDKTFCNIHEYTGWKWSGGCWGSSLGHDTVYYTNPGQTTQTQWCSGF